MPHITKIFLKIILKRMCNKLEDKVGEEQFGFRAGMELEKVFFACIQWLKKHIQVQKEFSHVSLTIPRGLTEYTILK